MVIPFYNTCVHLQISDLNQINESQRARLQELEVTNKELRRHVAVCEASDSAPSSSGVSSIPTETMLKQTCEDIMQEYQSYNVSGIFLLSIFFSFIFLFCFLKRFVQERIY